MAMMVVGRYLMIMRIIMVIRMISGGNKYDER